MFNIVKKRDFMLADNLPTAHEAELVRMEKYGHEYIVVIGADIDPATALLDLPDLHARTD